MFRNIQEIRHFLRLPTSFRRALFVNNVTRRRSPRVATDYLPHHRSKSFSGLIVNFLKDETRYIAAALTNDNYQELDEQVDLFRDLKPELKLELDKCLDDYNRFVRILHSNPSDIPSYIYIYYIRKSGINIDDSIKGLTIQRLAYHNLYDLIWKYLVDETSSINDIEEIVENIGAVLRSQNCLRVGTLRFITSLQSEVLKESLKNVIVDSTCHNFDFQKSQIIEALGNSDIELSEDESSNSWEWLIHFRSYLITEGRSLPAIKFREKLPGWFSYISDNFNIESKEQALNILKYGSGLNLNDSDISKLILLDFFSVEELFVIFKAEYSVLSDFSSSLSILLRRAVEQLNETLVCEIVDNSHDIIRHQYISDALQYLYRVRSSRFPNIIDKLVTTHKNSTVVFEEFFKSFTSDDHNTLSIHKALLSIQKSPNFLNIVRHYFPIPIDQKSQILNLYTDFLQHNSVSTKVLLELVRNIMIRNKLYNEEIINIIFICSVEKLMLSKETGDEISKNDKTMKKFHNTIRSLAQAISLLNPDEISVVFNNFHAYISESGVLDNSAKGFKEYVFENLLNETISFLERTIKFPGVKEIVNTLEIPSDMKKGLKFFCEVGETPTRSLAILDEFKDQKSQLNKKTMTYIEKGILSTKAIDGQQRIAFFQQFRNHMLHLGYKSKLRKKTVILLIDLAINSPEGRDSEKLLDSILAFSIRYKIPRHVVNRWINKIKT